MAFRELSSDAVTLVRTVYAQEPTNEVKLAKALGWPPERVANMVTLLMYPTPGFESGLLSGRMQHFWGRRVEHAMDVRVTALGMQVCDNDVSSVQA